MPDEQLLKFSERFSDFMREKGLNASEIARTIGYNRSETIRNFASGRGYPSSKLLIDIAEYYSNLNWNWLITGKGDPDLEFGTNQIAPIQNESTSSPSLEKTNQKQNDIALERALSEIETLKDYNQHLKEENQRLKKGNTSAQTGT